MDVTGTWEGSFHYTTMNATEAEWSTQWVLQQNGPKVTGEVHGPDGALLGSVTGMVNGEVFSWRVDGKFASKPPARSYRGAGSLNSDELEA